MLKPGANYHYLMSDQVYSKKQIESQISHYCKSEGINLSYYAYLMETHKGQGNIKSKLFKLSLEILSVVSITLITLYNLI
ncbi:hypothetical protein GOM49_03470 [Clostridium bovifaecis]|uniref:Uncharacterized protein n=1 Tax=Clostridium bovifaecis TaxID=2184719 RepID=A0A6I6F1L3_9CLOT|nr:hypothetical protein GOM49_03470 [Clostridium bovifaecis]